MSKFSEEVQTDIDIFESTYYKEYTKEQREFAFNLNEAFLRGMVSTVLNIKEFKNRNKGGAAMVFDGYSRAIRYDKESGYMQYSQDVKLTDTQKVEWYFLSFHSLPPNKRYKKTEFENIKKDTPQSRIYSPCFLIEDKRLAHVYLRAIARHIQKYCKTDGDKLTMDQAVEITKSNIGYLAGYHTNGVRKQVKALFGAIHPVLGDKYDYTPEELLEAGAKYVKAEMSKIVKQTI